ncbi:MAG: hypothetical protein K9N39_08910, partial [Candidatus Cloacimonetes bacterium]|nr:hypothetical protein [Candidatus Cloacimonadota bacterium]MCF7814382.1 hypothetical protein [Candidatus Cloacimonadota bacterium]
MNKYGGLKPEFSLIASYPRLKRRGYSSNTRTKDKMKEKEIYFHKPENITHKMMGITLKPRLKRRGNALNC